MITYTLKIVEIRKETEDVVTICFKQPALKKIKYLAGQYLTLIFRINGRRYIRPYSFSSCPHIDPLLEVTIKRVLNGMVSNHIIDHVKAGDSVEVLPPMGDFIFEENEQIKQVYLWGVGSGITPLFSLCKHILHHTNGIEVHLAYGNRNHESTIFANQITQLQHDFPDRFTVIHFHTQMVISSNTNLIEGRIDESKALQILSDRTNLTNSAHYICGPVGLKESVKKALLECEVNIAHVFSEDFELIKDPKDFEEIHTQQIELSFNGQQYHLEIAKGKSILEAALDANIELPYSCQTGNCSTCKGKVAKGEVKMIGLSKEREDLATDDYLLCCSHPLTENVYIEI